MGVSMRRTVVIYLFAAAAALAGLAPVAHGQRERDREEYSSRIDTTIAFSRTGTVELQAGAGEIIISSWSREQVRVRATSERSALRFEASAANLTLGLRSGAPRSGDTRFELTVPVGVRVRANTSSGDIRITGSKGEVEARTQRGDIAIEDVGRAEITAYSGDVDVSGVAGELRINAFNGDVRVRGVTGDCDVRTVSGEIDVREARSRLVRLGSTSGDLAFDGTIDPAGRYELETHSGDVDLTLPLNIGVNLSVSTFSGEIESDFPMILEPGGIDQSSHGKRLTFTIGRGGARMSIGSFSGNITIRSRSGPGGRNEGDR
jgi:DUF4097 and DUF4098 domain-containing protein YvlB